MTLKTTLEQLESVQTLIATIETEGQAWTGGDRQLTHANLPVLNKREERLLARCRAEQCTGVLSPNIGTLRCA